METAIKELNLKPLDSLERLSLNMEVYGIGWDGEFQKGIITDSLRHVKFNNEFGGCKVIGKKYYLDRICFGTCYSVLYSL